MDKKTEMPSILELLPQRPPFVIVDRLVAFNDRTITTELLVKQENKLFIEDGRLSAPGIIENIAQTCATRIGYINWLNHNAINIGYIGAIRELHIFRLPMLGETISTTIEAVAEIMKMTLVKALVKSGDEVLAEAEMKIALSDKQSEE